MYTACLFCHSDLGANHHLSTFPVGRRIAFDPKKGRLWVVCTICGRWNLTPLEERWEAIDDAERLFRGTRLRMTTDNIGLAQFRDVFELVRIGPALKPEIASWRYGSRLALTGPELRVRRGVVSGAVRFVARGVGRAVGRYAHSVGLTDEQLLRLRTMQRRRRVLALARDADDNPITVRYQHLGSAEVERPERDTPWRLHLEHDAGRSIVSHAGALRVAGRLLATINAAGASRSDIDYALAKLDAAADPEGYFTRVSALAMRTSWGRFPDAVDDGRRAPAGTFGELLALQLSNRSFWGRGGTNSEQATALFRLPPVDRLALEMASNEDLERLAMAEELDALREAWREAEEIASIADAMFNDGVLEEFRREYERRESEPLSSRGA